MKNEYYKILYKLSKKAAKKGEVPVAALIVRNKKIVAMAYNTRKSRHNPLLHAEVECLIKAAKKNHDWRLNEHEMYVTLEPCKMCKSIINESRIKKVHFLISNEKNIECKTLYNKENNAISQKYYELLTDFFKSLR